LCTTKAIYSYLQSQASHNLPAQGSRSITHDANLILQKVWKSKLIPPLLKTFAWRLIRRALATGETAGRFSNHIDKYCTYCGQVENDVHLFFKCNLSTQVWATFSPSLPTHIISDQEDGVQIALPLLLSPTLSDNTLCSALFTLWYLWKARNDNRFQRKTWTSSQVHKAAQAHLQNYLHAIGEQDQADGPQLQQMIQMPNYSQTSQPQGIFSQAAGPTNSMGMGLQQRSDPHQFTHPNTNQQHAVPDRYFVQFPSTLQGVRCYSDASITPDVPGAGSRQAGIGIFIVNTEASSILMAESAALALAASTLHRMNMGYANLLVDNQLLVNYINGSDPTIPPDWKIKPYTQVVHSLLTGTNTLVHRISRNHNQMADLLARQSVISLQASQLVFSGLCSNPSHVLGCPLLSALRSVTINSVMVLTASCC
jgi:hypothetical protein